MTPGIGDPGAYERLMGKLPYKHVDVVVPVELPTERATTDLAVRRAVSAFIALADELGLRNAVTHDLEHHKGSFKIRLIGHEDKVDEYRARLQTLVIQDN